MSVKQSALQVLSKAKSSRCGYSRQAFTTNHISYWKHIASVDLAAAALQVLREAKCEYSKQVLKQSKQRVAPVSVYWVQNKWEAARLWKSVMKQADVGLAGCFVLCCKIVLGAPRRLSWFSFCATPQLRVEHKEATVVHTSKLTWSTSSVKDNTPLPH